MIKFWIFRSHKNTRELIGEVEANSEEEVAEALLEKYDSGSIFYIFRDESASIYEIKVEKTINVVRIPDMFEI